MLQIATWKRVVILLITALFVGYAVPNLFYGRVEGHNDALRAIETQGETPELAARRDAWPDWLPSGLVNLGLDLRGGAHILAEVHLSEVYADRMNALWPDVRDALRDLRDQIGGVRRQDTTDGTLSVKISNPAGMQAALEKVRALSSPVASLSSVGSRDIEVSANGDVMTVQLSEAEKLATDDRTMQQSLEIVRRRIDAVGTREPTIQRQGDDRILIEVPGIGSAAELKAIIGTTAKLTFQPVVSRTSNEAAPAGPGNELLPASDEKGVYYVLEQTAVVTGEELTDAQPSFDQNGRPAVTFRFNPTGARKFGQYTSENIGAPFAIVLDGEVISAPTIQSAITGGSGIITGNFTIEESTNLAVLLRAGALPAGMTFLEERTIGPELGADSVKAGKLAALVGSVLVVGFMAVAYGLFGWFANIALALNLGMMFGALSLIGGTLTLPGIAGIVLTVGMAVDANVLIYERIREELKRTKGPARAIELGYEKALSSILDSNITTLITAGILFFLGSGPVKGFAVTLGLGIITSVFSAYFLTRLMVVTYYARKRPRTVLQWGLRLVPDETDIDFFRIARVTFGGSVVLLIASIIVTVAMGLNFGIDFKGGTTIRTESAQPVDVGAYRDALAPLGLGDVTIAEVFDPTFRADQNVAQIRIQAQNGDEAITAEVIDSGRGGVAAGRPGGHLPVGRVGRAEGLGRADLVGGDRGGRGGAGDLGLHLAAVRMAVRAGRLRGADPRRRADGGAVRAVPAEVRPVDHRGAADHRRLFDQRYRGGVRPGAREPDQVQDHAAAAGAEPVGQRDPQPDADDLGDHAGGASRAAGVRRRRDPRLRLRDHLGDRGRDLFVDLHRQEHRADAGREAGLVEARRRPRRRHPVQDLRRLSPGGRRKVAWPPGPCRRRPSSISATTSAVAPVSVAAPVRRSTRVKQRAYPVPAPERAI